MPKKDPIKSIRESVRVIMGTDTLTRQEISDRIYARTGYRLSNSTLSAAINMSVGVAKDTGWTRTMKTVEVGTDSHGLPITRRMYAYQVVTADSPQRGAESLDRLAKQHLTMYLKREAELTAGRDAGMADGYTPKAITAAQNVVASLQTVRDLRQAQIEADEAKAAAALAKREAAKAKAEAADLDDENTDLFSENEELKAQVEALQAKIMAMTGGMPNGHPE